MRIWAILIVVTLGYGAAAAEPSEARKHYEHGLKAYNLQDFKAALEDFKAAYLERADPVFLFNIGQAQRQLGQYETASKSYRAYLNQAPNAPNRADVERLIERMDQAAREARAKEPPTGTQAPRELEGPVTTPAATSATTVVAQPVAARRWYKSVTGWSLVAGGVVLIAIGGALLGVAASNGDSATHAGSFGDQTRFHDNDLTYQKAGWPLLGVGGAALVSGAVVFGLEARR